MVARWTNTVLGTLLLAYTLFHIYTSLLGTFLPLVQRSIFVGIGLALAFLTFHAANAAMRIALSLLGAIAVFCAVYVVLHNDRLMDVMEDLTTLDKVVGIVTILLALEGARRTIGWSLPVIATLALVYYLAGHVLIGGDWQPPLVSGETALRTLASQTTGVFGYLADIGTRVIAIFVIYGSVLMALGGGDVFMKAATLVAGRSYGGPAKVAVVSSALFGTISGSAVANVMAVGTMTIPIMARGGYPKSFAAGVEATASAGGQIMPPIMGAGAFIMAEWLDIPYAHIAAVAVIPALLYFASIFFSVDALARLNGLKPISRADLPKLRDVFHPARALPTFGSMVAIVVLLFHGYTPTVAGAAATMLLVILVFVARVVSVLLPGKAETIAAIVTRTLREVVAGLVDAGRNIVMIAVLLACAGIVVAVLSASGVAVKFSALMVSLADVDLFILLVLTALLCIMLGMDVPTTASYILASSVVAGSLGALGLKPLTAHMFIFYFAILSAITPPVCASVYAAATIAKVNFWQVAKQALRIGGAVYFIPFLFVYRPALMLDGSWSMVFYDFSISLIAIYAMAGGMMGYFLGRASIAVRAALIALSFLLFYPQFWADIAGIAGVSVVALFQLIVAQRNMAALRESPTSKAT